MNGRRSEPPDEVRAQLQIGSVRYPPWNRTLKDYTRFRPSITLTLHTRYVQPVCHNIYTYIQKGGSPGLTQCRPRASECASRGPDSKGGDALYSGSPKLRAEAARVGLDPPQEGGAAPSEVGGAEIRDQKWIRRHQRNAVTQVPMAAGPRRDARQRSFRILGQSGSVGTRRREGR